jgi:hypothetical protein
LLWLKSGYGRLRHAGYSNIYRKSRVYDRTSDEVSLDEVERLAF